mmetsp:Transcript_44646/g.138894  ORF Transcript_44646/g.138894 Transcript_44646/m.138894 type:complete len:340 (+) Transcript_44646:39-1058(+)
MRAAALLTRGVVLLLTWSSLPQHLGASLRVPPTGAPSPEAPSPDVQLPQGRTAEARTDKLPLLSSFSEVWEKRHRSEHWLRESMPSGVQLVLGIFAQPWQTEYRKVIRRTWLNQTGVCLWRAGPPASDCRVQVAFVYGNRGQGEWVPRDAKHAADLSPGSEEAAREEPGSFVLDVEENMNKGKTFAWFKAAAEASPWATHIAKCDMDTYPFLHKLVKRMSKRAGMGETPYEYAGSPTATCNRASRNCFHSSCGQKKAWDVSSFKFMYGPLYMLSHELVDRVVRPGEWWEANQDANWEDQTTSMAIDITAAKYGFCVSTWCTDAHFHTGGQVSETYANNL